MRPALGKIPAGKLSTSIVMRYMAERRGLGRANGTVNREISLLRRAFSLGRKGGKIAQVPHMPRLKENNTRKGFFEHDQYLALREALPAYLRPVLAFAYYTGCRRGEILALRWSQVDFDNRVVRLEPGETKNDEARILPMVPELFETLRMQRTIRDERFPECELVFSREGEPILNFRNAWDAACTKAKLVDAAGKHTRIFHDLRRTGVRNLVRSGVSEAVAMRISGHKTRSVFDRYNIVSEADIHDAGRKLAAYVSTLAPKPEKPAGRDLAHYRHTRPKSQKTPESEIVSKLLN